MDSSAVVVDISTFQGGYPSKNFVKKPPDSMFCGLCLEVLNNPYQCSNGHCFCKDCISEALGLQLLCPMCRISTPGLSSYYCVSALRDVIDQLPVRCHCQWTGPAHQLMDHRCIPKHAFNFISLEMPRPRSASSPNPRKSFFGFKMSLWTLLLLLCVVVFLLFYFFIVEIVLPNAPKDPYIDTWGRQFEYFWYVLVTHPLYLNLDCKFDGYCYRPVPGGYYFGHWRNGTKHGFGITNTTEIESYGTYADDVLIHGYYHRRDEYALNGAFDGGSITQGQYWDLQAQTQYNGTFRDTLFDGFGELKEPGYTYVGEFRKGVFHGRGNYTSAELVYSGYWIDGKRHGQGRGVYTNGEYTGEYRDGQIHGQGTFQWNDGSYYSGDWVDSRTHGRGEMYYHNGDYYVGEFENDARHGQGNVTYADGTAYHGEWSRDQKHGNGAFKWKSGTQYHGEWQRDKKVGRGELHFEGLARFAGEYRNDMRFGQGVMHFHNGDWYEGEYAEDKKHGQGEYHWANGAVYTGEWRDDYQSGKGHYLNSNGDEYVGEWKEDKFCGSGALQYANGDRYEGEFASGTSNGAGRLYVSSTGVAFTGVFKKGELAETISKDVVSLRNSCVSKIPTPDVSIILEFWQL